MYFTYIIYIHNFKNIIDLDYQMVYIYFMISFTVIFIEIKVKYNFIVYKKYGNIKAALNEVN